jgi:hypothetical protein
MADWRTALRLYAHFGPFRPEGPLVALGSVLWLNDSSYLGYMLEDLFRQGIVARRGK